MIIVIAGKQSTCPNEKQKDSRRVSNLVLTAHAGTFVRPRNRAGNALRPASGSDRELDRRTISRISSTFSRPRVREMGKAHRVVADAPILRLPFDPNTQHEWKTAISTLARSKEANCVPPPNSLGDFLQLSASRCYRLIIDRSIGASSRSCRTKCVWS
jgi:hypothetical protein